MKNHSLATILALATLGGSLHVAEAQRAPIDRSARREQRQTQRQATTGDQRAQIAAQRGVGGWQGGGATQGQAIAGTGQVQGTDPNNPTATAAVGGGFGALRGGRTGGNGANRNGGGTRSAASREDQQRAMMIQAGITDKSTQDAIIAFADGEASARQPLLPLAREVAAALNVVTVRTENTTAGVTTIPDDTTPTTVQTAAAAAPTTDDNEAKVASSFEAYEKALTADKARHEKALADLDAKIGYSKSPRIKSFLSLVGLLDNDVLAIGGPGAIFSSGQGGNRNGNQGRNRRQATNAPQPNQAG